MLKNGDPFASFFILDICPNVNFLPLGIKMGSYPNPFFPLILVEIVPFKFPCTVVIFPRSSLYERLQTKVAFLFFFIF